MTKFIAATAVLLGGLLVGTDEARADHCRRGVGYYGAYGDPYGFNQPYGFNSFYGSGPYGNSFYGAGNYGTRVNIGIYQGRGFNRFDRHHHRHNHGFNRRGRW